MMGDISRSSVSGPSVSPRMKLGHDPRASSAMVPSDKEGSHQRHRRSVDLLSAPNYSEHFLRAPSPARWRGLGEIHGGSTAVGVSRLVGAILEGLAMSIAGINGRTPVRAVQG